MSNIENLSTQEFNSLLKSFTNSNKRVEKLAQQIFICCAHDLLASHSCARLNAAFPIMENSIYCKQFMFAINCVAGNFIENDKGKFYKNNIENLTLDKKEKVFNIIGELPKLGKIQHFRAYQKGVSNSGKPLLTWQEFAQATRKTLERKFKAGTISQKDVKKFQELLDFLD